MKILFLTQYFPPEVGAPQNRIYELAVRLKEKDAQVSILTAMPNYPQMEIHTEYKSKFYVKENLNGLDVHRAYIFVKKSNSMLLRLINYFSFVFTSLLIGIIKIKRQDIIICESPPLFLGISGVILSKLKSAKFIFNVSDLWPESAEKLKLISNKFLLSSATILEELIYKNSSMITGQTKGIINNISSRFPDKKTYWLKNGVDLKLFPDLHSNNAWRIENRFNENDFILYYGGIIGYAQGLEVILNAAIKLKEFENIKFVIIGAGPEKKRLESLKEQHNLKNLYFFNPVTKSEIPYIISSTNAAIIPLKKLELFKGAIPSKIFEALASKKPILLGVEGEAKELFIEQGNCGLAYTPEDGDDLADNILKLYNNPLLINELGENGLQYVSQNFNRDKIAQDFWNELNFNLK